MVNIQDSKEFKCQQLNRDVWSNESVRNILAEHFILWQVNIFRIFSSVYSVTVYDGMLYILYSTCFQAPLLFKQNSKCVILMCDIQQYGYQPIPCYQQTYVFSSCLRQTILLLLRPEDIIREWEALLPLASAAKGLTYTIINVSIKTHSNTTHEMESN